MLRLLLPLALALSLLLSGCIQFNVGIHFTSQTQGEIVQRIQVGDRINLKDPSVRRWLQTIEGRSRALGGTTQHLSSDEVKVTIPFTSGRDLTAKFNAFFSPVEVDTEGTLQPIFPEMPFLEPHLTVTERNLLLVQRDRLSLNLDLRPLAVRSPDGKVILAAGNLLDLQFRLTTPWGASVSEGSLPSFMGKNADLESRPKELVWVLKPGELNHLEATFWVPSPLGYGSVAIALFVILGSTLRAILFSKKLRT